MQIELVDATGQKTGESYNLKFCDIQHVVDFLVLRQHFDASLHRLKHTWKPSAKLFRSIIEDRWYYGELISHEAYPDRPETEFLSCRIQ